MHFSLKLEPIFSSSEKIRKELLKAVHKVHSTSRMPAAEDLCQIVSELVNNAVEHGQSSFLQADFTIDNDKATFTLTTDGIPFDPTMTKAKMPDFDEHNDLPEGGYGLAIIHKLADSFFYSFKEGNNVTTVVKLF